VREPYKEDRFSYEVVEDGSVKFYDHSVHNGILYCQFDYSANVQGVPAFFEVNVGRYANKGGRRSRRRGVRKSRGLKRQLGKNDLRNLLKPLWMCFGEDFTYTLVVARDTIRKVNNPFSNLGGLRKRGGIVIPIYATREQFRNNVLQECTKRGIEFKVD
jgi:hypothetical protein